MHCKVMKMVMFPFFPTVPPKKLEKLSTEKGTCGTRLTDSRLVQ